LLESGVSRDNVIALFLLLFVGKTDFFLKSAALLKDKIKGWSPEKLAGLVKDDMKTRLAMENALLSKKNFFPPDIKASEKRFNKLKFKALNMGLTAELAQLETSLKKIKDDPKTQKEYSAVCREITKNVSEMNE
jgi:hypothetical protein